MEQLLMLDLAGSLEASKRQHAAGCVKTQEDLARYEKIITDTQPEVIVELGTFSGRSAEWMATVGRCQVVTVDINDQVPDWVRVMWGVRVQQFLGNTIDPEIVSRVRKWRQGKRTMVILDSDHSAAHVHAELEAYGPMVTQGCYCVVEDGLVRWMPWEQQPVGPYVGSPLDAIEQWLSEHPDEWVVDEEIEDMFPTTQFPSGFLRRT